MKRVAYFGTEGNDKVGHFFIPFYGQFTREEQDVIEKIDSDIFLLRCIKWNEGFQFFLWGNYG